MELKIIISLIGFFLTILFYLFTKLTSSKSPHIHIKLPPQPCKLPLLGHLHHLTGSLPHRALANLSQKHGPIIHLKLGELTAVVISSPALAKQVMSTNDLSFANRPKSLTAEVVGYNYTDIVFSPHGEYWRQMRKICILELLSAKKVKAFSAVREQESWNLVESMVKQGPVVVNLSEKIFSMTSVISSRVTVGSRCEDQAALLTLIEEVVALSSGFYISDLFPSIKVLRLLTGMRKKLMNIRNKIDKMFDAIIYEHQQRRVGGQTDQTEDILDVLLRIKDEGALQFPLTFENIKAIVLDMIAAGTDTAAVTIDWAMFELMRNPRVRGKLQEELRRVLKGKKMVSDSDIKEVDYLYLVIKEILRLHPPLPLLIPRECTKDCEIGGYSILADTTVITNVWKIGRDPDYWTDPENFIPERFSDILIDFRGKHFEYLPFGAGRRICPGMNMGLANVELVLARLLYHFDWELPTGVNPEDLDGTEVAGAVIKRKNHLHLVPSAYNTTTTTVSGISPCNTIWVESGDSKM